MFFDQKVLMIYVPGKLVILKNMKFQFYKLIKITKQNYFYLSKNVKSAKNLIIFSCKYLKSIAK